SSSGRATATVCDVGTGSGCIAVSIAHERPSAAVTAIDISASATAVARRNAERHGVASRIQFRGGDLFDGVHEQYDLIVSNPPYVPEGDRATIQAEVGRYEPGEALFAGADGLATIRRLVEKAPAHLAPGGHLVFEFGFGQSDAVADLISRARAHNGRPAARSAGDPTRRDRETRMTDCLFCKIARREIPASIVYEDDRVLAFNDINPQGPTHVLVVPKQHIATLNDLSPDHDAIVGELVRRA